MGREGEEGGDKGKGEEVKGKEKFLIPHSTLNT
jgi:hypothetical protein